MFRKVGILFCLAALFVLGGGHWAALQTVAWVRMIADYAKDEGVSAAIAMTFNGRNPCDMCKGISKGKSEEKKSETVKSEKKVETPMPAIPAMCFLSRSDPGWGWLVETPAPQASETPPLPPPKAVLA